MYAPGLKRIPPPPEPDMRDPAYRAYYAKECGKIDAARGCVSQLGGQAKPAVDRTQPLGPGAQPMRQVTRDHIKQIEKQQPRR